MKGLPKEDQQFDLIWQTGIKPKLGKIFLILFMSAERSNFGPLGLPIIIIGSRYERN